MSVQYSANVPLREIAESNGFDVRELARFAHEKRFTYSVSWELLSGEWPRTKVDDLVWAYRQTIKPIREQFSTSPEVRR